MAVAAAVIAGAFCVPPFTNSCTPPTQPVKVRWLALLPASASWPKDVDAAAKEKVKEILKSFGWAEKNMLELGDISKARGTEMYLPLWLNIYEATKSGAFNIKIVS